jgi:inhibitor of KinA sporulation pathway (predicted exonuclease)
MKKAKKFDKIIVVDLEATCWDTNNGELIPPGEQSEIIEVGVCELNLKTLELEDREGIIVKPTKSRVSDFCTRLTSITQEMVDKGITLAEVMTILKEKYQMHKRTMAAWGDYDKKTLLKDCADKKIEFPGAQRSCINVKNLVTVSYGLDKELGLDEGVEYFGLSFEGRHHRGVDDATMIAKIFRKHLRTLRNTNKTGIFSPVSAEEAVEIAKKAGILTPEGVLSEEYKQ